MSLFSRLLTGLTAAALFIGFAAPTQALALSIGKDGDAYIENDISWQPVRYDKEGHGITAVFPGNPSSGLMNGLWCIHSDYNDGFYRMLTQELPVTPPADLTEFVKDYYGTLKANETVECVSPEHPQVILAFQMLETDAEGNIAWIENWYFVGDRVYLFIVQEKEPAVISALFNSISFY